MKCYRERSNKLETEAAIQTFIEETTDSAMRRAAIELVSEIPEERHTVDPFTDFENPQRKFVSPILKLRTLCDVDGPSS